MSSSYTYPASRPRASAANLRVAANVLGSRSGGTGMPSARAAAIAAFINAATSPGVGRAAADVVSTGSSSAIGANPSLVPVMVARIMPTVRAAMNLPTGVQNGGVTVRPRRELELQPDRIADEAGGVAVASTKPVSKRRRAVELSDRPGFAEREDAQPHGSLPADGALPKTRASALAEQTYIGSHGARGVGR
jgi:hypothetical protein